jgi:pimeloyl-ACP methyl ester carboxylesterase
MTEEFVQGVPSSIRAALATGSSERILEAVSDLADEDKNRLESLLGTDAVRGLQRNARRARSRLLGKVIVTHGITGSELASLDKAGDRDTVWVNLFRLFRGRIADLQMNLAGDSKKDVRIEGIRVEYLPLIVELSNRWDVLPFAYDWREDIDKSAARLDAAVARWAKGQPCHIVAHSMGGLVARRFIQLFGQRWTAMHDTSGKGAGGRLVMLGTPNHGSFAVTLMLSGAEKLMKWLDVLDRQHSMKDLLKILNSFHGSYQMLPSPLVTADDDRSRLAAKAMWGNLPVSQALLDRGLRFQREIAPVVDPGRMIYVAGYDRETPWRIKIGAPGDFSYQHTLDGDGRVPHELGLLEGVPTFWLNETHGDLPRNARLHAGINDLLRLGSTDALESRRPRSRSVTSGEGQYEKGEKLYEIPQDDRAALEAVGTTTRGAAPALGEQEAAIMEADLLADYLGGSAAGMRGIGTMRKPAGQGGQKGGRAPQRLPRIEVHCGDITQVEADVYAVGHYIGVEPQHAELAIDCAVSGVNWRDLNADSPLVITQLTRRGVIKGELGDIHFYPFAGDRGAKQLAAIAGMGAMGTFGRRQLVRLSESLFSAAGSLPGAHTLCMVLIGSGVGGLSIAVAVRAIVEGVRKALGDSHGRSAIKILKLVEMNLGKAHDVQDELERLKKPKDRADEVVDFDISTEPVEGPGAQLGPDYAVALALSGLTIATSEQGRDDARSAVESIVNSLNLSTVFREQLTTEIGKLRTSVGSDQDPLDIKRLARRLGVQLRRSNPPDRPIPTRLSVSWDGTNVLMAALTDVAVVPERASGVQRSLIDEAVRCMTDPSESDIPRLSRRLNTLLLPRDFRDIVRESSGPVIFEVDREMAKVHWELVAQDTTSSNEGSPIGLQVQFARQLRTAYSAVPAPEMPPPRRLRALVIGDPGDPDLGHALAGARREALQVATFLDRCEVDVTLMIGAPDTPQESFKGQTVASASLFYVLCELMDGGYDILHYAGHGDFDAADPTGRSGWLFKGGLKGELLTARELERVDVAPRLVVANACLSGLTSDKVAGAGTSGRRDADLLPGLADEFFRRGVRNYVGTAWEVDDLGAIEFARVLYACLIERGGTLGEAMLEARKVLEKQSARFGALWAAYQHYGSPGFMLKLSNPSTSEPVTSRRKAAPPPRGRQILGHRLLEGRYLESRSRGRRAARARRRHK